MCFSRQSLLCRATAKSIFACSLCFGWDNFVSCEKCGVFNSGGCCYFNHEDPGCAPFIGSCEENFIEASVHLAFQLMMERIWDASELLPRRNGLPS